jgi:hypothetical protein
MSSKPSGGAFLEARAVRIGGMAEVGSVYLLESAGFVVARVLADSFVSGLFLTERYMVEKLMFDEAEVRHATFHRACCAEPR